MSLPQEDSIMPIALTPPRSMRVLKGRERTAGRNHASERATPSEGTGSFGLIVGALCALVLLALPLPLLLDGTVSLGPRAGLLAMFFVPPIVFMVIVQTRYGRSGD